MNKTMRKAADAFVRVLDCAAGILAMASVGVAVFWWMAKATEALTR